MEPQTHLEPTSRPLSGTEFSWCRSVPDGTGITVLALLLSKPIDHSNLETTLHKLQNSHPLLRAKLTTTAPNPFISISPSSSLQIQSLDASATTDLLARISSHTSPPHESQFHSLLEHELNQNPWSSQPDNSPTDVIFATVYALPESESFVLALRLHTAVCDLTSGAAILMELMGLMREGEKETESVDGGGEGGGEGMSGIEDLIPKQQAWKPFWARGRDIVGYSLNFLRTTCLRFEDVESTRSSEVVRLVLSLEETRKLLSDCKARGIKLCEVLTAAGLVAANYSKNLENNQPENYSVVTLVDCRKYLDPVLHDHHLGFYYSAIINTHTVHEGEGLWEVATRCHTALSNAMDNRKHLTDISDLNFLMCKAIDNPHMTPSSSMRTSLISVFEEPVIYESSELHYQLGVEDYVGCSSVHGIGPSIALFETIRDGQLDCTCVYPSSLHSRKQMQELVEHMKRVIVEGSHVDEAEAEA